MKEGMCTLLTFLITDVQNGDQCCHRCAHPVVLKAHRRPLCTNCSTTVTNSNVDVGNMDDGNSSVSNVQFGNPLS